MSDNHEKPKSIQFIREICKGKTEEEILDAEENFRDYLWVIKEMCDRLEVENYDQLDFDDERIF